MPDRFLRDRREAAFFRPEKYELHGAVMLQCMSSLPGPNAKCRWSISGLIADIVKWALMRPMSERHGLGQDVSSEIVSSSAD